MTKAELLVRARLILLILIGHITVVWAQTDPETLERLALMVDRSTLRGGETATITLR